MDYTYNVLLFGHSPIKLAFNYNIHKNISSFSMAKTIKIHLHDLDSTCYDVIVNRFDPIIFLQDYLNEMNNLHLIFNGTILMTAFSFAYYNIIDGSHLYAVLAKKPQKCPSAKSYFDHNLKKLSRYKRNLTNSPATNFHENKFEMFIEKFSNRSVILEASRLSDLSYMREKLYEKVENPFDSTENSVDIKINEFNQTQTQNTENVNAPSSDVLPVFW